MNKQEIIDWLKESASIELDTRYGGGHWSGNGSSETILSITIKIDDEYICKQEIIIETP